MTAQEEKSMAIAKHLTKSLLKIETFDGDPEMIFTDASVYLRSSTSQGAKDALAALKKHYAEE